MHMYCYYCFQWEVINSEWYMADKLLLYYITGVIGAFHRLFGVEYWVVE